MSDMDTIIKEFLVESYENLDQLDRDLVCLEENPLDAERLASIFRTIHSIKGTAGFFGFAALESVTHAGESLLCELREGRLRLNPEITSGLLALVDAVRKILANVEASGDEGQGDYAPLIACLTRLQQGDLQGDANFSDDESASPNEVEEVEAPESRQAYRSDEASQTTDSQATAAVDSAGELKGQPDARGGGLTEGNIRVDVGLLDKLMNLVGELVLARNQILQFNGMQNDSAFLGASQRLNLITTELQEGVMKTRMQPIGNIWNKFPRIVRDLALACGKQVRIEMEGKETELDKTIIEAIKDPLTHLVRNAVDHGIEMPEARKASGKPSEGRLLLRAFHEGGHVNVEIADDGAGIDVERLKHKALERGLVSPDRLGRMSERELLGLIFLPGFSTAARVTNISGRGVGMDVVKTNIEKIGGTVDVQSEPGQGTTIKIKIPLTLAIIPALIVSSGGERYAIPQVSLLELVRLDDKQAKSGVEQIHGVPVYRLRGQLLPLVYLNQQLQIETDDGGGDEAINIVVLQADDRQFGLVVDGINDTEEIVVKPLGQQLKGNPLFAGATIMGDGHVALILDVMGMAQRAGVVSESEDRSVHELASGRAEGSGAWQTLLLLAVGRRRMALPISIISRLEEIPRQMVELADGREVVQYRDHILPLIRLAEVLETEADAPALERPLQVVVYSEQDWSVGIVVDEIVDIVETVVQTDTAAQTPGVVGSAVIQQHVTDLIDLPALIRRHQARRFHANNALQSRA